MSARLLQILPGLPQATAPGIVTDCLSRLTAKDRWEHHVLHPQAAPSKENISLVGDLPSERVHHYIHGDAPFVEDDPGWEKAIADVLQKVQPQVIHSHYLGHTTAVIAEHAARLNPTPRFLTHGYGQEFTRLKDSPSLAKRVTQACQRCEHIILHSKRAAEVVAATTGAAEQQIYLLNNGLDDCFCPPGADAKRTAVLYCGELKQAGGLAWLIDAVEQIATQRPDVRLHVTGDGEGRQRDSLVQHMETLAPLIQYHGPLPALQRADVMQQCHTIVSPVFAASGIQPLLEAAACGCRIVCTSLPRNLLASAPQLTTAIQPVPPPSVGDDNLPLILELPVFRRRLGESVTASLASPLPAEPAALAAVLSGRVTEISHLWS